MKLQHKQPTKTLSATDILVQFVLEGGQAHPPAAVMLPRRALEGFKGEFREARLIDAVSGPARQMLVIGVGRAEKLDQERLRRVAALAVQRAEGAQARSATFHVAADLLPPVGAEQSGAALAEGALLGAYKWEQGKSKPKGAKLAVTLILGPREIARGVLRGTLQAEACAFVRDLQNEPANRLTPRDLAASAKSLARPGRVRCKVLEPAQMKRLGMNLLLGVAAGSKQPARLIHLTYTPPGRRKGKVALVGKGLTFDSGGISIKPSAKMDEMRFDMSGAAAVLGVFHALRRMDVPFEVHGIIGATENMPGGNATKPGDIHVAMDGTTVEVLNTDAEGRLVLADCLCYVKSKVKPNVTVDLATLTGAVVMALGHEAAGLFTSSDRLERELRAAGEETGERLWPLPLFDVHKDAMKGSFGDLKNIAGGDLGAGASAGAAFLAAFVPEGHEWAHLDIAGTAWGGSARDWVGGPMGSGFGARLLLRWLATRG